MVSISREEWFNNPERCLDLDDTCNSKIKIGPPYHDYTFQMPVEHMGECDKYKDQFKKYIDSIQEKYKEKIKISYKCSYSPNSPISAFPVDMRKGYKPFIVVYHFWFSEIDK